jgi:aryl-alcohol dehydrogenase-like predicted oxidoreductase
MQLRAIGNAQVSGIGLGEMPMSIEGRPDRRQSIRTIHAAQDHDPFQAVAAEHDVSPQRVARAWMLATSPVVIPIPGSSRPETVTDSAAATDLVLTPDELAALHAALAPPEQR